MGFSNVTVVSPEETAAAQREVLEGLPDSFKGALKGVLPPKGIKDLPDLGDLKLKPLPQQTDPNDLPSVDPVDLTNIGEPKPLPPETDPNDYDPNDLAPDLP